MIGLFLLVKTEAGTGKLFYPNALFRFSDHTYKNVMPQVRVVKNWKRVIYSIAFEGSNNSLKKMIQLDIILPPRKNASWFC
jgi:hypothetical protein